MATKKELGDELFRQRRKVQELKDALRTARVEALSDVHSRFMDQAEILEAKSISGSELPAAHEILKKLKGIVWDMLREAEQASAGAEGEKEVESVESEAP